MAAVKFCIRAGTKRGKLHQQRQLISLRDWWEHGSRLRLQMTGAANWCTILKASSWGGGLPTPTAGVSLRFRFSLQTRWVSRFYLIPRSRGLSSASHGSRLSCSSGFINNWSQAVSYFLESDFTSVCSALKCWILALVNLNNMISWTDLVQQPHRSDFTAEIRLVHRASLQPTAFSVWKIQVNSTNQFSSEIRRVEVGGRSICFLRTLKRRWRLFSADKVWIYSCLTLAEVL